MASLLCPSTTVSLQHKVDRINVNSIYANAASTKCCQTIARNGKSYRCLKTKALPVEGEVLEKQPNSVKNDIGVVSLHHVGILCENLERSLDFYQNILGLEVNLARPDDKLPYRGAWLWVGAGMIHLMELPNPDPLTGRPEHGGLDRHTCVAIKNVSNLKQILDEAGIPYTLSRSGRPAIFFRDPDANALEFAEFDD